MSTRSIFASALCLLTPSDAFRVVTAPGSLEKDVTGQTQAKYDLEGTGVAGSNEKWNVGNARGKGVVACYAAVTADPECAQDYFSYSARHDLNCGCKKGSKGEALVVREDDRVDYYRIKAIQPTMFSAPTTTTTTTPCTDTPGFTNGAFGCEEYDNYCSDGAALPGNEWLLGEPFKFPEQNCCACGKGQDLAAAPSGIANKVQPELSEWDKIIQDMDFKSAEKIQQTLDERSEKYNEYAEKAQATIHKLTEKFSKYGEKAQPTVDAYSGWLYGKWNRAKDAAAKKVKIAMDKYKEKSLNEKKPMSMKAPRV